jgi:hypothetical protein
MTCLLWGLLFLLILILSFINHTDSVVKQLRNTRLLVLEKILCKIACGQPTYEKVNEELFFNNPLHVILNKSKLAYRIYVILIANKELKKVTCVNSALNSLNVSEVRRRCRPLKLLPSPGLWLFRTHSGVSMHVYYATIWLQLSFSQESACSWVAGFIKMQIVYRRFYCKSRHTQKSVGRTSMDEVNCQREARWKCCDTGKILSSRDSPNGSHSFRSLQKLGFCLTF